jgi:hypothetical protein
MSCCYAKPGVFYTIFMHLYSLHSHQISASPPPPECPFGATTQNRALTGAPNRCQHRAAPKTLASHPYRHGGRGGVDKHATLTLERQAPLGSKPSISHLSPSLPRLRCRFPAEPTTAAQKHRVATATSLGTPLRALGSCHIFGRVICSHRRCL